MIQKLLLNNPKTWEHHRSGWAFALNAISSKLCGIRGVLLEGYADGIAQQHRQIDEPWVGFIHNPVTFSKEARQIWHWMRGLDQILESEEWAASKPKCLGLFTLSQHCAEFLRANTDLQISSLLHPTAPGPLFSVDKFLRNQNRQLITIGWWLRKFQSLADLETDLNKAILKPFKDLSVPPIPSNLRVINRLSDQAYDELLTENVVFLDLYATSANNAVIECMIRHTPLIIKRLPATVEYLGPEYPLLFDDLAEVPELTKTDAILAGHRYLANWDQVNRLTADSFVKEMAESDVFKSL